MNAGSRRVPIRAVGIVASSGGPIALCRLLSALPSGFAAPVLIAQHRVEGTTDSLRRTLAAKTSLWLGLAENGAHARPGWVYLAPDHADVEMLGDGELRIVPAAGAWNGAGDRLLESLARHWRDAACGVVLSGLGDDGARGLQSIRSVGGLTLAEDEASAPQPSMPRAAAQNGAAERTGTPEALAELLWTEVGTWP